MTSRFRFSTPDSRGPSDPWFRIGTLDVTTTVFVVLLGVVAMFLWAINPSIIDPLLLLPSKVRAGEVWRIVTWPAHNQPSLGTVITLAIFWFFGRDLESLFGRRRFVIFLLALTIIPGLVATGLSLEQGSLQFIELAVFVTFAAEHPQARFFFGIPAWVIAAVIVGIQLLQLAGQRQGGQIAFLVVVCALAVLLLRSFGFGEAIARFVPAIPIPGLRTGPGSGARPAPRRKTRRSASAEPRPIVVQGPWAPTSPDEVARQARIDSLLDKIAATGLDSLTPDERKWLNDASKRSRDDRR